MSFASTRESAAIYTGVQRQPKGVAESSTPKSGVINGRDAPTDQDSSESSDTTDPGLGFHAPDDLENSTASTTNSYGSPTELDRHAQVERRGSVQELVDVSSQQFQTTWMCHSTLIILLNTH
jgi:hypothetical protein